MGPGSYRALPTVVLQRRPSTRRSFPTVNSPGRGLPEAQDEAVGLPSREVLARTHNRPLGDTKLPGAARPF